MLAVAVHLHVHVVLALERVLVARLDRATDTEVLGQVEHVDAMAAAYGERGVAGTVVHHDVVVARGDDALHRGNDALFLVVRRNDDEHPWLRTHP